MNEATSGHVLVVNGKTVGGTFECGHDQLDILNDTIKFFLPLVVKDSSFSGEVSLMEILAEIENKYDMENFFMRDLKECLTDIHRKSVTIH